MPRQITRQDSQLGSRRSLLINSTSIFLSRIITILVSLISVPIVLNKLGIAGYGTWESILAISLLFNIFQSTISGTLLWKISHAHGLRDIDTVQQYIRMGIFFSLLLFFTVLPFAWAIRHFLIKLFQIPEPFRQSALLVLPCIAGLMLLGTINEVLAAVLAGLQRSGLTTLIQAAATTCNNLIVILCLVLGFSLWSLLIGFAVGFVISGITLYITARRVVGRLRIWPMIPTHSVLLAVGPYAGFMLLHSVSAALRDQTDKVVLSAVASPLWTGYFGIASRLAGLVPLVSSFFYIPTIAAAGALSGQRDAEKIHRLYHDIMTITSFSVGLFAVVIAGLHDRLLLLWLDRAMPDVSLLLYLLLAGYTFAVIMTGAGTAVCKGTGNVKMEAIYIAAGSVLNIVLKIALVPQFGPIGTVVSSTISWILSSSLFVFLMHKNTDLPLPVTLKGVKTVLIVVFLVFFSRQLAKIFVISDVIESTIFQTIAMATILTGLYIFLVDYFNVLSFRGLIDNLRLYTKSFNKGRIA